ncbi:MAG: hypothetical protein HYT89_01715 [Candidatus Omnitrophica bacterium]|nr:hypothetical protein [Candidatus Omnitrophota bacterium]
MAAPSAAWAESPRAASAKKISEARKTPDALRKTAESLQDRMARRNDWESGLQRLIPTSTESPLSLMTSQGAAPAFVAPPVHLSIRLVGAGKVGIFADEPTPSGSDGLFYPLETRTYDLFYKDAVDGAWKPLASGAQAAAGKPIWKEPVSGGQRFYQARVVSREYPDGRGGVILEYFDASGQRIRREVKTASGTVATDFISGAQTVVQTTISDPDGRLLEIRLEDADKTVFSFQYESSQAKEPSSLTVSHGAVLEYSVNLETGQAIHVTADASLRLDFEIRRWRVSADARADLSRMGEYKVWAAGAYEWVEYRLTPSQRLRAPENAPYLAPYLQAANAVSGLTNSHLGDNPYGTFTYDMALLAMLDFGPNAAKVLGAYASNSRGPATADRPQVQPRNGDFSPNGAVLNDIRIKGFTGNWWETWDWSAHGGPNAWIGLAALQNYRRLPNPAWLTFAKERAAFLVLLQDADGGLRMGPKGQYYGDANGFDRSFYWNTKSTENNLSELRFFDMLYEVTGDSGYKNTADRIWDYLKRKMVDKNEHAFFRGEHSSGGVWTPDPHGDFATDTATWAPMGRMLDDPFFGATRADRLREVERFLDTAREKTGVKDKNGKFVGVSFSVRSASITRTVEGTALKGVVSVEWTSQYALRRLAISEEWARLGDAQAAGRNLEEYRGLVQTLGGFFKNISSGRVAPYAVWPNGSEAVLIDTGHGWFTPRGPGSLASDYFLFAQSGFDPLVLGGIRKS